MLFLLFEVAFCKTQFCVKIQSYFVTYTYIEMYFYSDRERVLLLE